MCKYVKNAKGYAKGYGGCLHCRDRWNWKPNHIIPYGKGVREGAWGRTLEEMKTVLGVDPEFIDIETLRIANAIWVREDIMVCPKCHREILPLKALDWTWKRIDSNE